MSGEYSDFSNGTAYPCFDPMPKSFGAPQHAEQLVPTWVCPVAARIALGQNAHCEFASDCTLGQKVPTKPVLSPMNPWDMGTSRDFWK